MKRIRRPELWGWVLFLGCALILVGIGVRDADAAMIVASLLFLLACLLFLLPYRR